MELVVCCIPPGALAFEKAIRCFPLKGHVPRALLWKSQPLRSFTLRGQFLRSFTLKSPCFCYTEESPRGGMPCLQSPPAGSEISSEGLEGLAPSSRFAVLDVLVWFGECCGWNLINLPNDCIACVSLLPALSWLIVGSSGHASRSVCQ